MKHPELDRRLIRTKVVAAFVLCFTALSAVLDFRNVLIPPRRHPHWLLDLHFLHFLPNWTAITINLFFYVCFLWLAVECWRMSRGTERFLLGSFGTAAFLGVITNLVPVSTVPFIRDAEAAFMAVAFLAALAIFVSMFKGDASAENRT